MPAPPSMDTVFPASYTHSVYLLQKYHIRTVTAGQRIAEIQHALQCCP